MSDDRMEQLNLEIDRLELERYICRRIMSMGFEESYETYKNREPEFSFVRALEGKTMDEISNEHYYRYPIVQSKIKEKQALMKKIRMMKENPNQQITPKKKLQVLQL